MDETALYYCAPPTTTTSSSAVPGRNGDKKRLTVGVAANAAGNEKPPLLFVCASAKPRRFDGKDPRGLGLQYSFTKKGWINRALFQTWPAEFNQKMKQDGRRILLVLDSASAHLADAPMTNVEVEFLLPNTTAVLQPIDAGVIASLKAWLKRRQGLEAVKAVKQIVASSEPASGPKSIYNASALQTMRWCQDAWESAAQSTIANSWTHRNTFGRHHCARRRCCKRSTRIN